MFRNVLVLFLGGLLAASSAYARNSAIPAANTTLTYADIADLALAAKITAAVRIKQAERLKGTATASVASGRKRYLISAEVLALIRAVDAIPARISYVVDVAPDARGKFPKLTRGESVIFAQTVPGFPSEVRLVSPDGQIPATPDHLSLVRSILKAAQSTDAPPAVSGVSRAFHVPGAITGEGETQIFLETSDGRPISFVVVRMNGVPPAWSVSLGELVDQGAPPPARNTLLWYRLACFLPPTLPADAVIDQEPEQARIAAEDYQKIMSDLGTCKRTLTIRPGT